MNERDAKVLTIACGFTVVMGIVCAVLSWAQKRRGGAPSESELYITKHSWVLLPAPIVILIIEIATGFPKVLYDLFNESQPSGNVGVMVGGIPLMGTASFFVLVACVIIAGAVGIALTSLVLSLILRAKRK